MAASKIGRGSDQFPLRLPGGLRDRIKQESEISNRSMNSEIVSVLEAFYIDKTFAETLERRAVDNEIARNKNASTEATQLALALEKSEKIQEIQASFVEALSREKDEIAKSARLSEELALQFLVPIQLASEGKTDALDRIIERARNEGFAKKLIGLLSPGDAHTSEVLKDFKQATSEANRERP